MQAIITKYVGPTNMRGSRYSAKCEAKSISVSADHALNAEDNHIAACLRLRELIAQANAKKYGIDAANDPWMRPMVTGQIPSGEYVHVFVAG